MVDFECMDSYGMEDLERIVALLRAPGGCPWDREQTHESIRRNMLEEAYEAAEAIDKKNPEHLKAAYNIGRQEAEKRLAEVKAYLLD